MELRTYWRVFLRRWWLAVAITAATAFISLLASPLTQGSYVATMRVLLSIPTGPPQSDYFTYDRYYNFLSAKYLTEDFIEVVQSRAFRNDVLREMRAPATTPLRIEILPRSERTPRVLTVLITSVDAAVTQKAAAAASRVITTRAGEFFTQSGLQGLGARVIDPPSLAAATAVGRNYLNVALRTFVGLLVGLGLVFLLHYLDTTLYDPTDVQRHLGLPVIGDIPPYPDTTRSRTSPARPRG